MGKSKKVRREYTPTSREARSTKENQQAIENAYHQNPVWQLNMIDMEHAEWGWKNFGSAHINEFLEKMKHYESRKWYEIHQDKKRDHLVSVDKLSPEAQKRLNELNLGDTERLYRLKFTGKLRIWGILHGHIFKILWFDPEHTVCPSQLRHT